MVAVLGDQYLRHQRLGRHAAVDWTVGCRGLDDRIFAGATAVTRPADQPNPELSGDIIQHLSLVFADLVQRTAAAGASFVLHVDHDLDPRQIGGQGAAVALRRLARGRPGPRLGRHLQRSHLLGHGLFQILARLLHRLVGQLLRSPAEAIALQASKLKPQPLDLGQRRTQDRLQCGAERGGRAPTLAKVSSIALPVGVAYSCTVPGSRILSSSTRRAGGRRIGTTSGGAPSPSAVFCSWSGGKHGSVESQF
jgi:hypothetical protein